MEQNGPGYCCTGGQLLVLYWWCVGVVPWWRSGCLQVGAQDEKKTKPGEGSVPVQGTVVVCVPLIGEEIDIKGGNCY